MDKKVISGLKTTNQVLLLIITQIERVPLPELVNFISFADAINRIEF